MMGYIHIDNLYKNQDILLFRKCYALEKIHGTSAHISWRGSETPSLKFFSGGASHKHFVSLFDQETLTEAFVALGLDTVTVYGEAYGGSMQHMSTVYGKELRFIAFDVKVDAMWVAVPDMGQIAEGLGLDVVDWRTVRTDIESLNHERDRPSTQAVRNGVGADCLREGVVLRPPIEVTKNNGTRIIAKHKQEAFSERATPQKVADPEKLQVLAEANAVAEEWVTEMRLSHVLDKLGNVGIEDTRDVIRAMVEDIHREAVGEIIESRQATRSIGKRCAEMFHGRLKAVLNR